jgi:transcriptional regulator with XRE-family HTH domain
MGETRFSAWLSEQLSREKLNYTSLAHLADVSPNTARAWCIGESAPSPEAVLSLAKTLHVDPLVMYRLLEWLPANGELKDDAAERLARKITQLPPGDRESAEAFVDHLEARQRAARER